MDIHISKYAARASMATQNSNPSPTSVVEIATGGNVIFVVGPDERRLQVCPSVLKNASKYFSNMFGPHFSEGQDPGADGRKEIRMPDDDADALQIVLEILHLRNDAVPEVLGPREVLGVAVAADKFDCVVAVKYASALWLNPTEVREIVGLGQLMGAAYILDNARAFCEITLAMMLRYGRSYISLVDENVGLDDSVLWRVIYLLEERRSQMHTKLQEIVIDGIDVAGMADDPECSCGWSSGHMSAYVKMLKEEGLWLLKVHDSTISQVVEKLERMGDPVMPHGWAPCSYRWHGTANYRGICRIRLDDFKRSNGLCIDCVRSGTTATKRVCRIQHKG